MSDTDWNPQAAPGGEVITPQSVKEIDKAVVVQRALTEAVMRASADPTVPGLSFDPAEAERVTQAIAQAAVQDPTFVERFFREAGRRLSKIDLLMLTGAATGIYAVVEMVSHGLTVAAVGAGLYSAGNNVLPLVQTIAPRVGAWLGHFVGRKPA